VPDRLPVTRTSTTPLAKRPPRHLPHNPLPQKWTLPSEFAQNCCHNAAPGGIARADMLRTGFPSSSSRSPAFSAAPVRSHHVEKMEGGHATKERMLTDMLRLPRWRDPGPRRVHGRHHPLHHPQRQGPRYEKATTTPKKQLENSRKLTYGTYSP
jgi:hypothetical protein